MAATREGERVDTFSTIQATRYGQLIQGVDDNNLARFIKTDNSGKIVANIGGLIPEQYDEIALTYVTIGNGIGQIETVTYKLSSNTIAILTLSYDVNDNLSGVIRS